MARRTRRGLNRRRKQIRRRKQKEVLWELLNWLMMTTSLFAEIQLHGNIKWKPEEVAIEALIWSWMESKNVTDAFDETLEICEDLGLKSIAKTYASFMNALTGYRAMFTDVLRGQFQWLAEQAGGRFFPNRRLGADWI